MDKNTIIERAHKNAQYFYTNTSDYQEVAYDDIQFVGGEQWTTASKASRGNRPQTVINDAPSYIRKVKEFYKRRQSSIKVTPVDNTNDPKVARIFQGIVDQIMRDSLGEYAMDKSFEDVLKSGAGFCYVDSEYESDMSFNQTLRVEYIDDPLSVFFDLNAKRIDKLDMDYAGWLFQMDEDDYKLKYNKDTNDQSFKISQYHKVNKTNTITLCRYYERTYTEDKLIAFIDPTNNTLVETLVSKLEDYDYISDYLEIQDLYKYLKDGRIISSRKVERPKIKWYILNGTEVVDEGEWAGKYIPIIPMLGEEYIVDGEKFYTSVVRWMKEPARLYNYHISNMAESLAMAPIAPFMALPDQVKNHEHMWASANKTPLPYLLYNPAKLPDGSYVTAPPSRQQPADIPSGWITAAQAADADKKNTLGIQEVAMGMDGAENSGRAILARSDQSLDNISTFIESRRFATHYLGMVLVDLIPKYYDAKRSLRILGPDGEQDIVTINDQGQPEFIDIKNTKFDIYIDEGPSFASQRKESQASFIELAKVMPPEYLPAIADKMVEYMDVKDSKEAASRIRKLMPHELFVEQGEQTPEQLQAQLQQAQQQAEAMQAQITELEQILLAEKQKSESEERQLTFKAKAELQKEMLKQSAQTQREMMSNKTDMETTKIDASTKVHIEIMKMMDKLNCKIDAVIAKIPKSEIELEKNEMEDMD